MYLFFDTETTGLPRYYKAPIEKLDNWPRLVQIAWLVFDKNEKCISKKEYIIKPNGFLIPEKATKIHGITTEKALTDGYELKPVLEEFSFDISNAEKVIAHNLEFDIKIVSAEFLRSRIKNQLLFTDLICTMRKSTKYCKIPHEYGGFKWPNLQELHIKLFKSEFKNAHDAMADVTACAKCYFKLNKMGVL